MKSWAQICHRKPWQIPRWRWILGYYQRCLRWELHRWWKQHVDHSLDFADFERRIRWQQIEKRELWDHVLRREPCAYCGRTLPFARMTIEHVIPKSHGGHDRSSNKASACGTCNRRRGAIPLLLFLVLNRRAAAENRLFNATSKMTRTLALAHQAAVRDRRRTIMHATWTVPLAQVARVRPPRKQERRKRA